MAKIYLSAAAHGTDNHTKCPQKCGENIHCNAYMDAVERRLLALGFEVMRGDKTKVGGPALQSRVRQANKWGADLYYVAHTNAGGGRYSMTMCWNNPASLEKARVFKKYRRCVKSHKVVADNSLYEIRATAMTCLYDELFFHDNAEDCAWFHNGGLEQLAEETVEAICEICGVAYVSAEASKNVSPAPKAGDEVKLVKQKLYTSSSGTVSVTRTDTFYLYDGVAVNGRYRVTNAKSRIGKAPIWLNVSGWVAV
jgi:hypothetical protein